MRRALLTLCLLAAAGAPGSIEADEEPSPVYEVTEKRLLHAGVDADLRTAVHRAIARGVAYLCERQGPDGSIQGRPGDTALVGLALRHSGLPNGLAGAREAVAWLIESGGDAIRDETYTAGITAMLLSTDRVAGPLSRTIHDRLAAGVEEKRGYWDYASTGGKSARNLSTSQFAALGVWATEQIVSGLAADTWRAHLEALLGAQCDNGSWTYLEDDKVGIRQGLGYPAGTFMGIANLALAHEALRYSVDRNPRVWARVYVARAKGRAALRAHIPWLLGAPRLGAAYRDWPYYALFALEKACLFIQEENVGGTKWYGAGARIFVDAQQADGSWSGAWGLDPDSPITWTACEEPRRTAFVLLYLLRATQAYSPVTPRDPSVTPREGVSSSIMREEEPPLVPPLPLEDADASLETLAALLSARNRVAAHEAHDQVRRMGRIHLSYNLFGPPLSDAHDAWCKRAETLLAEKVVDNFRKAGGNGRVAWLAVALRALDVLGGTNPRILPVVKDKVESMRGGAGLRSEEAPVWFATAVEATRRLGDPAFVEWILGEVLSSSPRDAWRTMAGLVALSGVEYPTGAARYAVLKAIVEDLQPLFVRAGSDVAVRAVGEQALVLARQLADPRAGDDFPEAGFADVPRDLSRLRTWWRKHGKPNDPVWSD